MNILTKWGILHEVFVRGFVLHGSITFDLDK